MTIREVLGPALDDQRFRPAFSTTGHPDIAPGRVALVCMLQYVAALSDPASRVQVGSAPGLVMLSDPLIR